MEREKESKREKYREETQRNMYLEKKNSFIFYFLEYASKLTDLIAGKLIPPEAVVRYRTILSIWQDKKSQVVWIIRFTELLF